MLECEKLLSNNKKKNKTTEWHQINSERDKKRSDVPLET
jgi:hypothetical protein